MPAATNNDMAGEGVVGLKELGAREMSYRLMFVACSTKVCLLVCVWGGGAELWAELGSLRRQEGNKVKKGGGQQGGVLSSRLSLQFELGWLHVSGSRCRHAAVL